MKNYDKEYHVIVIDYLLTFLVDNLYDIYFVNNQDMHYRKEIHFFEFYIDKTNFCSINSQICSRAIRKQSGSGFVLSFDGQINAMKKYK